jgi:hypothetical protein
MDPIDQYSNKVSMMPFDRLRNYSIDDFVAVGADTDVEV